MAPASGAPDFATPHEVGEEPAPVLQGTLVCVGDSITEGQPKDQIGEGKDYVSLLREKAGAAHLDLKVINQGRSGWTTQQYLDNAESILQGMPADATFVSILLGTNDTRFGNDPDELAQKSADSLRKLIALYHAKAPQARFIIMVPPAVHTSKLTPRLLAANYNKESMSKIAAMSVAFAKLASTDHHMFINLSHFPTEKQSLDGVHPDAAGHAALADEIWRSLTSPQLPAGHFRVP
jgi:lysophospholipase L1-like esterase